MWQSVTRGDAELVDLSIGLEPDASEPFPPEIDYFDHREGARRLAESLHGLGIEDVDADDFPDGMGLAWEEITLIPHAGTHLDAPWHYGPTVDGEPSRTIDEVPLEWCVGDAVVLDFTWKEPRTEISVAELEGQLEELDHELSAGEIVLIETGAEGTKHLVEQGVKVIGTDAYGFDKPFDEMGRRFVESGDEGELWPAHFAGREVEYCQIESMANLDELPRRTGIPLVTFPIEIRDASAGWVRPVAFVEGDG